jgi:hypothetical protein
MNYVNNNMTEMLISTDVSSMYDKHFTVLRYLLSDAVVSIFHLTYDLKRKAGNTARELTAKDVIATMDKKLKVGCVLSGLTSGGHGEVNTIAYPGDNMVFKLTSRAILQSSATGSKQSTALMDDPAKFLHASIAEVGTYGNQPKFDPTGRSRINPYLAVGVDGSIKRNSEFTELLDRVQREIRRC